MQIHTLTCGPLLTNTYIVYADGHDDCVVIDPADARLVLDTLKQYNKTCTHILLTHGHFDHIYGLKQLKDATNALVCIHELDANALSSNRASLAVLVREMLPPVRPDRMLKEDDIIEASGFKFRVIHTPGHSPGGVVYAVDDEKIAFCGDTVFYESVGRTDMPGCSTQALIDSFFHKVMPLIGFHLYPGHDEQTTVAHEAQYNPLIQHLRR